MSNTTRGDTRKQRVLALAAAAILGAATWSPVGAQTPSSEQPSVGSGQALSRKQQLVAPIAAAAAVGDLPRLHAALEQGLDASLAISEAKEILVQVYAYAGFPRSLNALGELMKVVDARRQRGVRDDPGRAPSAPIPTGKELLALGTANQTRLSGGPVRGPLFEFAPQVDEYLKTHLFGDIFARDNMDWQSRELATVGMLAAMPGVESQLQAHIRIAMNVGLTAAQLRNLADGLAQQGQAEASARARTALDKHLAEVPGR